MMLLHAGRCTGKTTQALAWLSHGERVRGYPGWSRVLLVHDLAEIERLRGEWGAHVRDHETGDRRQRLEDFDRRVYVLHDWVRALVTSDVDVCIDNLDLMLHLKDFTRFPGRVVAATITAEPWEPQVFHESVRLRSSYG